MTTQSAASSAAPILSIIIPTYGQHEITADCLTSLHTYPPDVPFEILIVDDASPVSIQPALAKFSTFFPTMRVVTNDTNLGFAGACNRGAAAAQGNLLLFLNNDTVALANWWPPLPQLLKTRPDIGIVFPKLIFPDGSIQHCGKVWKDLAVANAQPQHIYYRMPADMPCVNRSRQFTTATGACMLVRRDEFFGIGGFDERYANGWEDDDLCYKYQTQGLSTWYCAESTLIHYQNQSLQPAPEMAISGIVRQQQISSRFAQNRALFFSKWGSHVRRDDFLYYQEDGFAVDPDLPRYAPELRPQLGRPFESDDCCFPTSADKDHQKMVSIIILTWNQLDYTRQCLKSIQNNTPEPHEIIFVDNGSTDGTVHWLRDIVATNPQYHLIENQTNRGFSAGCNQGMQAASGDYLLLLNNDVLVTVNWLSGLLECLHAHATIGIVGPMTNNISGVQRVAAVGYECLDDLEPFAARYRNQYRHRRIPCRRIVGFCMLFRRQLMESVGLLDESFGSGNFEDDDYCIRAALEGFTNTIAGDVFIHHFGNASFIGNKLDYSSSISGNMQIFRSKWSKPVTDEQLARKIITLKALEKAELLFQQFKLNDAVQTLLEEGIRLLHDEKRFYYKLAEYLLETDKPAEALDTLNALSSNTLDPQGTILTGSCFAALGNYSKAESYADIALSFASRNAPALNLKGEIAVKQGDVNAAILLFRQAIEADPGDGCPAANLGNLLFQAGDGDEGLRLLERAVMLTPARKLPRNYYHSAISQTKEFSRGAAVLSEARHFNLSSKGLCYLLIDLYIHEGNFAAAIAETESALVQFGADDAMLDAALSIRRELGPIEIPADRTSSVSLCLIVKNEEPYLPRCLASLKPIVDEIIVVDTGSTDRTKDIAVIYGAKVFDYPWSGDFSSARNESIRQAVGDWILIMDADEVIAPFDHAAFKKVLAEIHDPFAYEFVTRNYNDNASLENWTPNDGTYQDYEAGGGWVPSTKIRLFPNHRGIFFEKPVHELVDYAVKEKNIPIFELPIPIHHYGYINKEKLHHKREHYYQLGRMKLLEDGECNLKALTELAIIAGELEKYPEAIELWQKALKLAPDYALAYYNLSSVYLKSDHFTEAIAAAKTALHLKNDYADAAINGATAALCLEGDSVALELLDQVAAYASNMPNYILTRGVLFIMIGREAEGYQLLQALQDREIKFTAFVNSMAKKLISTGKIKRAQILLKLANQTDSFDEETAAIARELKAAI